MAKTVLKLKKNIYISDIMHYAFSQSRNYLNYTDIFALRGEKFIRRFNYEDLNGKYIFISKNGEKHFYSNEFNPKNWFIEDKEE